tara:strand:+ start:363 stop:1259 length:897 start_codon:yes stop_codon:yes gene_type:complete
MSLPVKKIYVDTKNKTDDSISNSQFKWELPETISLPHNCIFYIDDITIPHSWYTINANLNDRLYIQMTNNNYTLVSLRPNTCHIVTLTPGHYNLATLAAEIQIKANTAFGTASIPNPFLVTPNQANHKITITPTDPTLEVKILTDTDLKTGMADVNIAGWLGLWTGPSYDTSNPLDINDILNNTEGSSSFFNQANPHITGYIDLQPIKNVYFTSPNLGTYKTFGPTHQRSVIKKVPVTAGDNEMIFDRVSSSNDYLDCSRQTLKTIEFELKDGKGNIVPLHAGHVSFTIVFDKYKEEE